MIRICMEYGGLMREPAMMTDEFFNWFCFSVVAKSCRITQKKFDRFKQFSEASM